MNPPVSINQGDTVVLHARAINRDGDSIVGASLVLVSLNPDTLAVDSAKFAVIGTITGPGRVIVKSGDLPSTPLQITIK